MNILDAVNKEIKSFIFRYYGTGDYSSYFDLEDIINNIKKVEDYFNNITFTIKSFDDYIDYLYLRKFSQFGDIIPFVKDEKKQEVQDTIKIVNDYFQKYKNKDVIKYLNENYKTIIDYKKYDIVEITLDIAIKYHSGCENIIDYFIDTHCYMLIYNFDKAQDIILKNPNFINKLLNKKHFDEMKFSGLKHYLSVISFLISKGISNENLDNILTTISEYASEIYSKINEDTYLQYESFYKELVDFFIDIKHKDAYSLEKKYKSLDTIRDNYLKKHGKEFFFEIPLDKIKDFVNDDKISLQHKLLCLTHSVRDKKIVSFLDDIGKNSKPTLFDQIGATTNIPYDSYFTISKQEHLQAFTSIMNRILQFFVNKDGIKDFVSTLASLTEYFCRNIGVNFDDTDFESDYNTFLNMFWDLFYTYDNKNEYLITGLNYGITMFIFGLFEKLLRYYYKFKKTDTYIKEDWFSLGHLLDENDEIILDLFGIDHLKILKYYLINSNIGFNFRNNYAHYKNIKHNDIHYGVTLIVLYLYIDVLNQIIIKIDENNEI